MKQTEIELQTKVENIEPLRKLLEGQGEFKYETRQVDEYYSPAHRDFLAKDPIEEWLRLRDANGKFSLNYKKWHFDADGRGLYADEYETKIENLEAARKAFVALDIKPVVTVEKARKVWLYRDYEICLDIVKGLGDYVEIEYYGERDTADHKEIMAEMIRFLKDLGCGRLEVNHIGYPALLLGRKGTADIL